MANARYRPRGDTAANWTAANPVLLLREVGFELDTKKFKVGDGTTAWASLPYWDATGTASTVTDGDKGDVVIASGVWNLDPTAPNIVNKAQHVADRAALAAAGISVPVAYLREAGREGAFVWSAANLSAAVAADTAQGIYVAPSSDTTGATGAWVRNFSGLANVKWFGARGDDSHDDTAAIVAALASGFGIFFPAGIYRITSTITLSGGVFMVGAGRTRTILKSLVVGGSLFNTASGSQSFFYMAHMKCLGNGLTGASGSGHCFNFLNPNGTNTGASTWSPQNAQLEYIWITGFRGSDVGDYITAKVASAGVFQYNTIAVTCRHVYVSNCGHGFYFNNTQNCRLTDCVTDTIYKASVFDYANVNLVIEACDLVNGGLDNAIDAGYPTSAVGYGSIISYGSQGTVFTGTKAKTYAGQALFVCMNGEATFTAACSLRGDNVNNAPGKAVLQSSGTKLTFTNTVFDPTTTNFPAQPYQTIELLSTQNAPAAQLAIDGCIFQDAAGQPIAYNVYIHGNNASRTAKLKIVNNQFGSRSSLSSASVVTNDITMDTITLAAGSEIGRNLHIAPTNVTRTACVNVGASVTLNNMPFWTSAFQPNGGTITANYSGASETSVVGINTGDQFTATTTSRLLGRGSAAGAGAAQEITLGTNLSMSGTTLNASGGGGGVTDGTYGDIAVSGTGTIWSYQYPTGFNAKRSGIVGNGSTDDTTNLQTAVTGNRHVYLPVPTSSYAVTGITVPTNTRVDTAGLAVAIHQVGAADNTRIINLNTANASLGSAALTGQIAVNGGEQNHGILIQGSVASRLSLVAVKNVTGVDMRGDVVCVGPAISSGAATISIASPGVVTKTAHGLADNTEVSFTTTGALPTGLAVNTPYYVRNSTANTFELAATSGGASINTSGSQSGAHTLYDASIKVEQVTLGHLRGTNVLRNILSITGGRAIDVASVIATGGNGLYAFDLETNQGAGRISGIRIGYGRGQYAGLVGTTAADLVEGADIGLVDIDPSFGTDTTPAYGATRSDGLTVRNTRSARIGTLLANGFNGQAIQQIYNSGELDQSNLKVGYVRVTDSCKTDTTYNSYIQGASGHSNYIFDFVDLTLTLSTHLGISNADNTMIGVARATVPSGAKFIAASNDGVVGSLQQTGGIAFSNNVRQVCLGGVFNGERFFSNCTQSVGITCNVTASAGAIVAGASCGFIFSTIGGTAYDLYTPFITIASASGNVVTAGSVQAGSYKVGTTTVFNSSAILQAAAFPALTGDVTTAAGSLATTLATVNSNTGTFGGATTSPQFSVNGKGLVTGVTAVTITPAWASITSKPTTLSGFGITDGQPLNANLTAYAGANWSAGTQIPALTAANTIALKTVGAATGNILDKAAGDSLYQPVGSYLTANQTINLSGDASGSGTTAITVTIGANKVTRGMLSAAAGATILGATGAGNVTDLTAAQAKTFLAIAASDVSGLAAVATSGSGADITPSIQAVTSAATVTPTFSNNMVKITAQAVGLTLANPTGTAVAGRKLVIRVKDNGTGQTIAYGTQYRAIGVTLPTTTVANKTLYLGLVYNSDDTKWDVVAVSQEA